MAGWYGSTRRQRMPANWKTIKQRIMQRDGGYCQIGLPGCTIYATDIDHTLAGDDHSDHNLRAACSWCNQRANIMTRPTRPRMRRNTEPHPGAI